MRNTFKRERVLQMLRGYEAELGEKEEMVRKLVARNDHMIAEEVRRGDEREAVELAGEGWSSRRIAERLGVSVAEVRRMTAVVYRRRGHAR